MIIMAAALFYWIGGLLRKPRVYTPLSVSVESSLSSLSSPPTSRQDLFYLPSSTASLECKDWLGSPPEKKIKWYVDSPSTPICVSEHRNEHNQNDLMWACVTYFETRLNIAKPQHVFAHYSSPHHIGSIYVWNKQAQQLIVNEVITIVSRYGGQRIAIESDAYAFVSDIICEICVIVLGLTYNAFTCTEPSDTIQVYHARKALGIFYQVYKFDNDSNASTVCERYHRIIDKDLHSWSLDLFTSATTHIDKTINKDVFDYIACELSQLAWEIIDSAKWNTVSDHGVIDSFDILTGLKEGYCTYGKLSTVVIDRLVELQNHV